MNVKIKAKKIIKDMSREHKYTNISVNKVNCESI